MRNPFNTLNSRYQTQIELYQNRLAAIDELKEKYPGVVTLDKKLEDYLFPDHPPHAEALIDFFQDKDESVEKPKLKNRFTALISAYKSVIGSIPPPEEYRDFGKGFKEDCDRYRALSEVILDRLKGIEGMASLLELDE